MSEGFVYVLTNAAMPGYVKIGLTRLDDYRDRMRQLDTTALPHPFECHFAARVPDCRKLEQTLHFVFGEKRTRSNREFFQIQPDLAKAIIELVAIEEKEVTDQEQAISPEQRIEIEEKKSRSERLTLERLGIMPGAVLTFTKDPGVTCVVTGPRTVQFDGEEMSLSAAALKAVRTMGYEWPSARGAEYWRLGEVKLADVQVTEA